MNVQRNERKNGATENVRVNEGGSARARANGKLSAEKVVHKRQRINEKMLNYEMYERSTWKQQQKHKTTLVVAPSAVDDVQ